jgi:hypothetical protein
LYHFYIDYDGYFNKIELLFCNEDLETNEIKNKIKQKVGRKDGQDGYQIILNRCFFDESN